MMTSHLHLAQRLGISGASYTYTPSLWLYGMNGITLLLTFVSMCKFGLETYTDHLSILWKVTPNSKRHELWTIFILVFLTWHYGDYVTESYAFNCHVTVYHYSSLKLRFTSPCLVLVTFVVGNKYFSNPMHCKAYT